MALFDLGGERIVAIDGRPAYSEAVCTVPVETTRLSAEEYARQLLDGLSQERAARQLGPMVTELGLAANSDN